MLDLPFAQAPVQQDHARLLMLVSRWNRAAAAHERWAIPAKESVDFVEGRQWDEATLARMARDRRPVVTINKINPLLRLVMGYEIQGTNDLQALPGQDAQSSEARAQILSRVLKQESSRNKMKFVDASVLLDGYITGRGYYDCRLSWDANDFGDMLIRSADNFSTYLDPDGEDYDLSQSGFVIDARWASIDEIEYSYGTWARTLLEPFASGMTPVGALQDGMLNGETTPLRGFGQMDEQRAWWDYLYEQLGDFTDPYRKSIRVMDFQYWTTERGLVFIDLETGDRSPVPKEWGRTQIDKALWHARQVGNPLTVEMRKLRRVRWTTVAADTFIYDSWSKYNRFTKIGFFPWFRRGVTRGMVDDLKDPQREVNKRRSLEIEIVGRSANGGWMYKENSLDPEQERLLRRFGARPGINIKWKGDIKPEQIDASPPPTAMERLEQKGADDLKGISGINESAMGEIDRVQSGKAILARQRQAVVGIELYRLNRSQSKMLLGDAMIEIVQRHYREPRLIRILGDDGRWQEDIINLRQVDPATGLEQIVNDLSRGKYVCHIDERPATATWENAQFEEALMLFEKLAGAVPPALVGDILVDLSSLPRKEEIKRRLGQALGVGQAAPGMVPGIVPPAGQPPMTQLPAGQLPVVGPASALPAPGAQVA